MRVVKKIHAEGARFLKFNDKTDLWEEVDDEQARLKVSHAMRDYRSRKLVESGVKAPRVRKPLCRRPSRSMLPEENSPADATAATASTTPTAAAPASQPAEAAPLDVSASERSSTSAASNLAERRAFATSIASPPRQGLSHVVFPPPPTQIVQPVAVPSSQVVAQPVNQATVHQDPRLAPAFSPRMAYVGLPGIPPAPGLVGVTLVPQMLRPHQANT